MSAITEYLEQLERELRRKRVPRRRLLDEVAEHLRESADEVAASGARRSDAEAEAVARFGAAALVAIRFAHAGASTAARTAIMCAFPAVGGYAVAAALFVLTGPDWLRDFPQGAPSMLALQVAAVALLVTGVRGLRFRRLWLVDELRVRLVAGGTAVATGVLAGAALLELLLALTRPAPAPWGDAASIVAAYGVASVGALAAAFVAFAALARVRALDVLPERGEELPGGAATLIDDVTAAAPPLRPAAVLVASRPALVCAVTAACAFAAMTAGGLGDHFSALAGAAATGLFEAAAVVVAYLALGRALGLRPPR